MNGSAPKVFLSYRHEEDAAHAGWLHDEMEAHFGEDHVFIDAELEYAEDFVRRITELIGVCESMVVVIGPRWATVTGKSGQCRLFESGDYVRYEVETAMQRSDVKVLPVLVGGADMPEPDELPGSIRPLARLNAIPVSDDLRRRRDDMRHLMATLIERSEPPPPTPTTFVRPLVEGVLVAAAAGFAGGVLGGAIKKTGDDDVTRILSSVTQRSLTWAVVGAAIAVWLTFLRGETRGALGRALLGLLLGALAGAVGGAIFGAAVNLPADVVARETQQQIQIGAIAATGGIIGALLGRLWIPPRAGPGFLAGAAGGALAQIILNAGDWGWPTEVAVGFRCVTMVTFVIATMFALDALRSPVTATASPSPRARAPIG